MKIVILAGGLGTRISEESDLKPKPMIEIGGKPILWHIMKIYSSYGFNDFIICCGYKGYMIKEYFANYFLHMSDVTFDLTKKNELYVHRQNVEPWKVTLVDTGESTLTGGRLKRIYEYVKKDDAFCFTYGDGLTDININQLIKYHYSHGKLATISATVPPGRYGALELDGDRVKNFIEKPRGDGGLINGGFFVLSPTCLKMISGDESIWEEGPLNHLSSIGELMAYKHLGFWQPMDTLREKRYLEQLWVNGSAPWKNW
jgi:glucose-1-phosphate cytidylyltransferase